MGSQRPKLPRFLALALVACWASVAPAQEGHRECRTVEAELSCDTYCLTGMPRDAFAAISWKPGSVPEPLNLELTVFKNGFEQGEVTVFEDVSLYGGEKRAAAKNGKRAAVYLGKDERDLGWKDLIQVTRPDAKSVVTLQKLEPNLLYRFLLVSRSDDGCVQSEVAKCMPAPCVADWVEEVPQ